MRMVFGAWRVAVERRTQEPAGPRSHTFVVSAGLERSHHESKKRPDQRFTAGMFSRCPLTISRQMA